MTNKMMFRTSIFTLIILLSTAVYSFAQVNVVEGYVFEEGNRGYLNQVSIEILNKASGLVVYTGETNKEGYFQAEVPVNGTYLVNAKKQLFFLKTEEFTSSGTDGEKKFVKVKMQREPGYDFVVTLAPKRDSEDIPVDAIIGAWIEVYNNTKKEEVLNIQNHPEMDFNVHFDQGNHYTIMIRKDGFLTKRMEAYVNVEGCILCFDGVGSVQPGVTDNLSDENSMGVLLANVEMDPLFNGKTFEVENIFYDLNKATLRPEAKEALMNLAVVIKDNPQIKVELGAHTDSKGDAVKNLKLSEKRAKSAVDYLVNTLDVSSSQLISAGFGEQYLKNECADGVKCSDEQHQENRRTEIRILNIDKSKTNLRSLAEIRVEEEFLKTVFEGNVEKKTENAKEEAEEEMGNSEQISEEEMKTIMEAEEKEKLAMQEKEMELQRMKAEEERKMQLRSEAERMEKAKQEQEMLRKEQLEKQKEAQLSAEEQFVQEQEEIERADNGLRVYKGHVKKIEKEAPQLTEEINNQSFGNSTAQNNNYVKLKEKMNPMFNYSGYKVVIKFSKDPISRDHEIYARHKDVVEYKATSGSVLYMIGDFKTEEKAEAFLTKTVKQIYPGAYVVGFERGKRLN